MAKRRQASAKRTARRPAEDAPLLPTGALAVDLLDRAERSGPVVHVARDGRRLAELAAVLRALAPEAETLVFPEWDCLPFDHASPSRATMGVRAAALRRLSVEGPPAFVLTTGAALAQRVPPVEAWADAHVALAVGDPIDVGVVTAALERIGYGLDERVDEPGEFAVRGRTLDVFPADAERPSRIEHAEGRVTAIRSYDPISQRSVGEMDGLAVDPTSEIVPPLGSEQRLRPFSGEEHALARHYPRLATLLDYLPAAELVIEEGTERRVAAFFEQMAEEVSDAESKSRSARSRSAKAAKRADGLYLTPAEWDRDVRARAQAVATRAVAEAIALPDFLRDRSPAAAFAKHLRARLKAGECVVLAGPQRPLRRLVREASAVADRPVRLIDAWAKVDGAKPGEILALQAPLAAGFRVPEAGAVVVAAADLYGPDAAPIGPVRHALPLGEVDLRPGDVAVDREHGLCVFEGLERVEAAGDQPATEALRLRFADEAVLMVPVAQADRIWRYGSEPEAVSLDRLDGGTWGRRRLEAEASLARTARHMLASARKRRAAGARPIVPPTGAMERFAAGFGARRPLRRSRSHRDRRGAALRRQDESGPAPARHRWQSRWSRADADRHTDSAHAPGGPGRAAIVERARDAPAMRQPVRTLKAEFDGEMVRAALVREHRRGGQSFVVCPRVEDIAPMAERLKALVPELSVIVAHGALKAAAMDEAMVRFADGDGDVLLATGIVESGLDVPRANTMLIHEPAKFGLAQLHQLRGRVGRGQRRGTIHLLSDPDDPPGASAEQRLRALEAMDRLGAGFAISARDLDLRGAGDLVGEDQAGHAKLVGLGLYRYLLELALRAAKGEAVEDWCPEIAIGLPGGIPEDYVPEPEIRLSLYTRLLRAREPEAIEALVGEVEDRFGAVPEPVDALFALARLRASCRALGLARLTGGPQGVAADLRPGTPLGPLPAEADLSVGETGSSCAVRLPTPRRGPGSPRTCWRACAGPESGRRGRGERDRRVRMNYEGPDDDPGGDLRAAGRTEAGEAG